MKPLLALAFLLLTACPMPDVPVVPPQPVPVPVPPGPTPIPTPPDEIARAKWDAVMVGQTEADVVALAGPSKHRAIVGPGFLSLGYYVAFPGPTPTKGTHYVEAVFGADGKVTGKTVW